MPLAIFLVIVANYLTQRATTSTIAVNVKTPTVPFSRIITMCHVQTQAYFHDYASRPCVILLEGHNHLMHLFCIC